VRYTREDLQMPPKGKLPDAVIADLEKWVRLGAPDPRDRAAGGAMTLEAARGHWAYQAIRQPALPETRYAKSELRNPIDAFVRGKLEGNGLSASPPADARTLLRRVTYDLTGLPPTADEVEAFVRAYAARPQAALEEVVDRLLASPAYGERW